MTTPLALVAARAERAEVGARARHHLPAADYADAFRVAAPGSATGEQWARRSLESGPEATRRAFQLLVWRGLLGMRLAPPGTPSVNGAAVVVDEPDLLVLAVEGRLLEARLVFAADARQASFSTLVRYRNPWGRQVWSVAQHAHRLLARRCLEHAARSLAHRPATDRR